MTIEKIERIIAFFKNAKKLHELKIEVAEGSYKTSIKVIHEKNTVGAIVNTEEDLHRIEKIVEDFVDENIKYELV